MTTTPPDPDPHPDRSSAGSASPDGPAQFTVEHRAAMDLRRVDQDRTLAAVHTLEAALAAAAPGRETTWRDTVREALDVLHEAAAEEQRNATEPDSILSDIARTQARLRHRVRGLRTQYRHVGEAVESLSSELADPDADPDIADLRQRIAWLIGSLRHQRARESDLIYEAYYEAFQRELEQDSAEPT
jgi:chromosome segregation ATPase